MLKIYYTYSAYLNCNMWIIVSPDCITENERNSVVLVTGNSNTVWVYGITGRAETRIAHRPLAESPRTLPVGIEHYNWITIVIFTYFINIIEYPCRIKM